MDTRFKSATEAFCNILVGWPISYAANMLILLPFADHLAQVAKTGAFTGETQVDRKSVV